MQTQIAIDQVYDIKGILGEGQNAKVVEAVNKQTGQTVALKIIQADSKDDMSSARRAREIEIWKSVKHANCVQMHEVQETPGQVVVEMELLKGDTLLERMVQKGRFTEQEAASAMHQILSGIQHLHDQGICHRDLQPENIMYAAQASNSPLKIVDFGLGRRHNAGVDVMRTVCGTPMYVAPEVFAMSSNSDPSASYDKACDIWSAGVILFCMLSGQQPFDRRGGLVGLVRQVTAGRYAMAGEAWRGVSAEAKELVKAMLTVDASRRISVSDCLSHPWLARRFAHNTAASVQRARAAAVPAAPAAGVKAGKVEVDDELLGMKGCAPPSLRRALSRLVPVALRMST